MWWTLAFRRTDRITKRSEHAEAGIPPYWVVGPENLEITCHQEPHSEEYRSSEVIQGHCALPDPGSTLKIDMHRLN